MALIDEMRALREDIESGKQIRSRRIQEIKAELSAFMEDASQKRKKDFGVLTQEVKKFITDLREDVKALKRGTKAAQKENRDKQKELKKMLAQASAAFWGKKSKAATKKGEEL